MNHLTEANKAKLLKYLGDKGLPAIGERSLKTWASEQRPALLGHQAEEIADALVTDKKMTREPRRDGWVWRLVPPSPGAPAALPVSVEKKLPIPAPAPERINLPSPDEVLSDVRQKMREGKHLPEGKVLPRPRVAPKGLPIPLPEAGKVPGVFGRFPPAAAPPAEVHPEGGEPPEAAVAAELRQRVEQLERELERQRAIAKQAVEGEQEARRQLGLLDRRCCSAEAELSLSKAESDRLTVELDILSKRHDSLLKAQTGYADLAADRDRLARELAKAPPAPPASLAPPAEPPPVEAVASWLAGCTEEQLLKLLATRRKFLSQVVETLDAHQPKRNLDPVTGEVIGSQADLVLKFLLTNKDRSWQCRDISEATLVPRSGLSQATKKLLASGKVTRPTYGFYKIGKL